MLRGPTGIGEIADTINHDVVFPARFPLLSHREQRE
jgi:hypothetical protein